MPLSPYTATTTKELNINSRFNNLELIAAISHEIRNPLNTIIGISRLLNEPVSEKERELYVNCLLETSENLLELLNNILDFSKLESGELHFTYKSTHLPTAVKKALSGFETLAKSKGLNFTFETDNSFPSLVIVDLVKVIQIIVNLVSNSIKFTEQGSVTIELKVEDLNNSRVIVKCVVKDTGIGIPEEKLNSIFEAFEQVSGDINMKYGGTGLGLSISQKLIHAMNGRLTVKSELGAGSEFSFLLPLQIPAH